MKKRVKAVVMVLAFSTLLAAMAFPPLPAHAYVGPGVGLTAIGAIVALVAALLLAVVGFIWYPVRRLIRNRKPESRPGSETSSSEKNSDRQN